MHRTYSYTYSSIKVRRRNEGDMYALCTYSMVRFFLRQTSQQMGKVSANLDMCDNYNLISHLIIKKRF